MNPKRSSDEPDPREAFEPSAMQASCEARPTSPATPRGDYHTAMPENSTEDRRAPRNAGDIPKGSLAERMQRGSQQ
jgi:hypothetical protein